MGRLVDADKYLAKAEHEATAMPEVQGESFVMLTDWLIGKTPTAYEVDKVVAKLEEEYITSRCLNGEPCEYPETIGCCYDWAITKAIEIVKRGGVLDGTSI